MLSFVWAHLRGRAARSLALLLGVVVATTGFTVLTGTTSTSQLRVTGTVDKTTNVAYDILVRPRDARTALENVRALVRPNYLSGLFGGLTMQQYEQVKAVPGIDVAAPIAMIGYGNAFLSLEFDLTDLIDNSADRQILRLDRTFLADHGLSSGSAKPMFVYVTRNPVSWSLPGVTGNTVRFSGGQTRNVSDFCDGLPFGGLELSPGGPATPLCTAISVASDGNLVTDRDDTGLTLVRLRPDGKFEQGARPEQTDSRLKIKMYWSLPVLLAAIDPAAEDRLVGLNAAVDGGRPLSDTDSMTVDPAIRRVPVLAASRTYTDGGISLGVSRLGGSVPIPAPSLAELAARLAAAPATPVGNLKRSVAEDYRTMALGTVGRDPGAVEPELNRLIQSGQTTYDQRTDGTLVPRTLPANPEAYRTSNISGLPSPWQIDDVAFRTVRSVAPESPTRLTGVMTVGTFDPERLSTFDPLSKVPLETYEPPGVTGADRRTRDLLASQTLGPGANPAGYVASPPLLLTTLSVANDMLRGSTARDSIRAPISAIRVRVAGPRDYSTTARERVRLVAEEIATRTGLDVDITYGSSPAPQTVDLAPGRYGRPDLLVSEGWSKKGVATAIITSVDRKSLVLFLLVLVVCALFLANAVTAAVRDRRSQLAVLACLGWPARRIAASILGEVTALGLAAGLVSLALAAPLGGLLDIGIVWYQALLAVPIAIGLSLVAGALPALRAARAHPADGLHPAVAPVRRTPSPRTVVGLGLVNLARVPRRTGLGAGSLAIGIAALTVLVAITVSFRGGLVGTLLGDAVSLRVRGVDTIAVAATVLLGAFAVGDVLYLNIRDRAAELAALRASGWSDGMLARLVAAEGFGIGVLGGTTGAVTGLAGAAWLVGSVSTSLLVVAAIAAAAGALVATAAALVPAALLRRLPTAQLLAEE